MVPYSAPRSYSAPRPIVVRVPSAPARGRRRRRSGGGGGGSAFGLGSGGTIVAFAVAAAVIGLAENAGLLAKLPTVPLLGKKGLLAVGAYYYSRHGGGKLARDVAFAAAALSGYELGKLGSISGNGNGNGDNGDE
jgi:hypothetical protein